MFAAILFDADGTLVDSEVLAREVGLAMLAGLGLAFDPADFTARFMGLSDAAFFAALEADALVRLGRPLPGDWMVPMRARLKAVVAERLTETPGARAMVSGLALPKAVASSASLAALESKLRKTGLWAHFAPHVYAADHVERAKPAPDLFLHAAAALGVPAEQCLVIEDSVNGVKAARAAGMTVWGFLGGGHADDRLGASLLAAGAQRLVANWGQMETLLA